MPRPSWPFVPPALFAGTLVLYAAVMPLGLGRVDSATQVAQALALNPDGSGRFLALFALRAGQYLPLGDTPLRATVVSAAFCAFAVALAGRLVLRACALLRPTANARQETRQFVHEPVAAIGAALAIALSLSTFELGVVASTASATLAFLVGAALAGLALLREPTAATPAFVLSTLTGLSAGVDPVAGPLLWPLLLGLGLWSLRKGGRWPLLAPLCFVAGWGAAMLAVVAVSGGMSWNELLPSLVPSRMVGRNALWPTVVELADQVGVIGALLAMVGIAALAARATLVTGWLLSTALVALLFSPPSISPQAAAPTRAAFPLAAAILCAFAGVGLVHVASRMGRARAAAAFALATILVLSPALDGGARRWSRRATLGTHLLDRALDRTPIRHLVCPGTPEMEGLFRLAKAQGLRPDIQIAASCARP